MLPKVRLITFDVTGTLMKHTGTVGDQYSRVIANFWGQKSDHGPLENNFKITYKEHVTASPLFGGKNGISAKDWWASVFCETLMKSGVISVDDVKHKHHTGVTKPFLVPKPKGGGATLDKAFNHVFNNFEWNAFPESHRVLKFIRDEYKVKRKEILAVGAISNNDDRISMFLSKAGLKEFIDFVITSHDAGCEKPDPKIFHQAVCNANKTKPMYLPKINISEMLHVGDSFEKDYIGAIQCGAQALLVDRYSRKEHYNQNRTITNLTGVLDYLEPK